MSHSPERKEKDCLNCGTIVLGKYCQVCGQENTEPKESFWSMLMHFFSDITHFDGKFFTTLKDLLFKPGFLSAEYTKGRRQSYLHPVRMYVFTSAIFFLVFFSVKGGGKVHFGDDEPYNRDGRRSSIIKLQKERKEDTTSRAILDQQIRMLEDTTRVVRPSDLFVLNKDFQAMGVIGPAYKSLEAYDSAQKALPSSQKDGFFKRLWNRKAHNLNDKYRKDRSVTPEKFSEIILHKLPYLLFVSLPFFAFILKLLYFRRKQFYYGDHAIFSVHHYVLSFILLLLIFLFDTMVDLTGWDIWDWLMLAAILAWPLYLLLAMKRFYRQNIFKTFLKFLLLNILGLVVIILLFAIFSLFSVFQL